MIEAYAIGVTLSLRGNIGAEMAKVGQQFELLNRIIGRSQMAVNELAAGMRGLSRVGRSAADSWTAAANAMERAARAAKLASGSLSGAGGGGAGPAANPASAARAAGLAFAAQMAAAANQLRLPAPQTGFTLPGGPLPTGGGSRALPSPTPIVPYMPNGTFAGGPGTGTGGVPAVQSPIPLNLGQPFNLGGTSRGPGAPMPTHGEFAAGAAGFGALGYAMMQTVESAVKARAEVEHLQSQMRLMGMTGTQVSEALAKATDLQQSVPGMTIGGGLHIIKDLLAVTQNAHESLDPALLRSFSQAAVVLQAAGKGDAIGELFKAMQAAELRGAFSGANGQPDPAKAGAFLQNVLSTTTQTGGRVGPAEILQFIKSGGLGAAMMSDRSLFADSIAPIISMGAARAGTGIQAFASQFTAGKMSDAAVKLMLRMHMFENLPAAAGTDPEQQFAFLKPLYKTGIGQWAMPQNMMPYRNDPSLNPGEHPIDFMDKVLLPRMDAYNRQQNGAPRDAADLMAQRMALALAESSRIPSGNLIGDVLRNMPLILRDREAIANAQGRNANDGAFNQLLATDPKVKMEAFNAALNGLMVALGGPIMDSAIKTIQSLTAALNAVSNFAEKYPDFTRYTMLATGGVAGLSVSVALLSGAMIAVPAAWAVLRWLPTGMTALGTSISVLGAANATGAAAGLTSLLGPIAAIIALAANADFLNKKAISYGEQAHDFLFGHGTGFLGLNRPHPGMEAAPNGVPRLGPMFGPQLQPQSYRPPAGANDARPMNINLRVDLDGRQVAQSVTTHQAREASGPPRGMTGFDTRETPSHAGNFAVAI